MLSNKVPLNCKFAAFIMANIKQKDTAEIFTENENIEVFGAREHNLKNIDISIPKNKLVVITGISGSGNLLSLLILFFLKVNAAIWKVFLLMHANLLAIWKGPM